MSASGQTTNYQLPIYEPTDTTSWLKDFNGAMRKIDAAIHEASESGSSVEVLQDVYGESTTATVSQKALNNAFTQVHNVFGERTFVAGKNIVKINGEAITGSNWGDLPDYRPHPNHHEVNLNLQPTLVDGENIKTVNGRSLLGAGDLVISANPTVLTKTGLSATSNQTINITPHNLPASGNFIQIAIDFNPASMTTSAYSLSIDEAKIGEAPISHGTSAIGGQTTNKTTAIAMFAYQPGVTYQVTFPHGGNNINATFVIL